MRIPGIVLAGSLSLTLALVAAVPAAAGFHGRSAGMHTGHGGTTFEVILEHLNLTEAQESEVMEILDRQAVTDQAGDDTMEGLHNRLIEQLTADDYNERAFRDTAETLARAQADRLLAHARMMWEVRLVLTPEQVDTLREFHETHPGLIKRHGKSFGLHHQHGGPPHGDHGAGH